ncbi:MAG: 3-deoxy-D-manno-octulosonic acid transferase [Hyphomicrobiales bacterium]|nr:MAG: 3-deoxy-D-manno-octulosonic acid transferase [Hyphomicrobiales bacterium]
MARAALKAYRGVGRLLAPALPLLTSWRARNGKEDPTRRQERFGYASQARPTGPLAWVHAASVGETNAVMPLLSQLIANGYAVLLTTTTVTAARIAAARLPEGALHQYVPFDVAPLIGRFLKTWRPDVAIFVESEIWPATLSELARAGIPRCVVNGRLSERSWRRWKAAPSIARAVFGMIDRCAAQTAADADRFRDLGVHDAVAAGNLKYDSDALPADADAVAAFGEAVDGRPVWIAASTHPGEEEKIIAAHERLRKRFPDLLTLLVPRHPGRGDEVAGLLEGHGIAFARRSSGDTPGAETAVYLADTIGEMGLFYRQAQVAFVGGSLVPHGGQNPIEPAQLGVAIVTGPHVHNFRDVYGELVSAGAVTRIEADADLAPAIEQLLADTDALTDQVERAHAIVAAGRGGIERTLDALRPALTNSTEASASAKPAAGR